MESGAGWWCGLPVHVGCAKTLNHVIRPRRALPKKLCGSARVNSEKPLYDAR